MTRTSGSAILTGSSSRPGCGLKLLKRFAADGATDYMRSTINQMDEETFKAYIDFHMATCERIELLGASSHVTDILEAAED